jgi:hypothetical protein
MSKFCSQFLAQVEQSSGLVVQQSIEVQEKHLWKKISRVAGLK